jgi:hypothetical protein
MIDMMVEALVPLADACALIPSSRGQRTYYSTLLSWVQKGVKAPGGKRVRLEALRVGGRWMTSREALQRFAEALTPRMEDAAP